jgi:capsule polysaccharide export protein KpsE/RkpR
MNLSHAKKLEVQLRKMATVINEHAAHINSLKSENKALTRRIEKIEFKPKKIKVHDTSNHVADHSANH